MLDLRRPVTIGLLLVSGIVVACSDSDGAELVPGMDPVTTSPVPSPTADASPPAGGGTPSTSAPGDDSRGAGDSSGAAGTGDPPPSDTFEAIAWDDSVLQLRDGSWQVGDAGEVEFAVRGPDELELIDVRAADGWTVADRDIDRDKIEIDFQRGNVEWEIEIEIEGGILEIEIDQDIEHAEPGIYQVGLAGAVEFALEDGALQLVEVIANDGWTYTIEEQNHDEIEVDFRFENITWDFEVELDDGVIEIEIDFEIEGAFPQ